MKINSNYPHPDATDLTTHIGQQEILQRLAARVRTTNLNFHDCGIVDAGVGYYQMARIGDQRLQLFVFNLENLQKCGDRNNIADARFASHIGLFPVNIYDDTATPDSIYADTLMHQVVLRRDIREKLSMARTGVNVFQSRPISYVLSNDHKGQDHPCKPQHNNVERHLVHAYMDMLGTRDYVPVFGQADRNILLKARYPRVHLTRDNAVECQNELPFVIAHYSSLINTMMEGGNRIEHERAHLNVMEELGLRGNIIANLVAHHMIESFNERNWKDWKTYAKLFAQARALFVMPEAMAGNAVEFAAASVEVGDIFETEHRRVEIPEELKPFILEAKAGAMTGGLYRLNPVMLDRLIPLTAAQSAYHPTTTELIEADPFVAAKYMHPSLNAIRAPLGAFNSFYETSDLTLQPNGVWMAASEFKDGAYGKLYVGYNAELDTESKPQPSPLLTAWLQEGRVLRFTFKGSKLEGFDCIALEEAQAALPEIMNSRDGRYLSADIPTLPVVPQYVPHNELTRPFRFSDPR